MIEWLEYDLIERSRRRRRESVRRFFLSLALLLRDVDVDWFPTFPPSNCYTFPVLLSLSLPLAPIASGLTERTV